MVMRTEGLRALTPRPFCCHWCCSYSCESIHPTFWQAASRVARLQLPWHFAYQLRQGLKSHQERKHHGLKTVASTGGNQTALHRWSEGCQVQEADGLKVWATETFRAERDQSEGRGRRQAEKGRKSLDGICRCRRRWWPLSKVVLKRDETSE